MLVQGGGSVGMALVELLKRASAIVLGTDADPDRRAKLEEAGVTVVDPERAYDEECDVFAPCAVGGVLDERTIARLRCRIVAGAANNPLAGADDARRLADREILYAPDFVINAGGLINVSNELEGYNQERALNQAEGIYDILRRVFERAKRDNIPTWRAANNLAMDRIEAVGRLRRTWTGGSGVVRGIS